MSNHAVRKAPEPPSEGARHGKRTSAHVPHFLGRLEQNLDEESASKVAYAAGLEHGKRRLATFLQGQILPGGAKSMAKWQDTAHASAGARHTSARFARYDQKVAEVVRTDESFGAVGQRSRATAAFFNGFLDGYRAADPQLGYADEHWRRSADGKTEFVVRFWYRPDPTASHHIEEGC